MKKQLNIQIDDDSKPIHQGSVRELLVEILRSTQLLKWTSADISDLEPPNIEIKGTNTFRVVGVPGGPNEDPEGK